MKKRTLQGRTPFWGTITEPVRQELDQLVADFEKARLRTPLSNWDAVGLQVSTRGRVFDLWHLGAIDDKTKDDVIARIYEINEK